MRLAKESIIISILVALLIVSGAGFFYYYSQSKKAVGAADTSLEAHKKDLADTIKAVGKLMVLPEGEEPTIATVSDPAKLSNQPFFAHAQTGDKVLIYTQVKKAILYNPSSNKIVEVAQINLGNSTPAQSTPLQVVPTTTPVSKTR